MEYFNNKKKEHRLACHEFPAEPRLWLQVVLPESHSHLHVFIWWEERIQQINMNLLSMILVLPTYIVVPKKKKKKAILQMQNDADDPFPVKLWWFGDFLIELQL